MADPGSGPAGFGHVPGIGTTLLRTAYPALTRYYPDGSQAVLLDATIGCRLGMRSSFGEVAGSALIGLDRDPAPLWTSRGLGWCDSLDRPTLVRTRYDCLGAALAESGYAAVGSVDGICSISASHPCSSFAPSGASPTTDAVGHADGPDDAVDRS